MNRDLSAPAALYAKAGLFVALAAAAGGLLILANPSWTAAALLGLCVWASCRAYYFAFYVVQHYVDPAYRFAGLADFALYLLRRRRRANATAASGRPPGAGAEAVPAADD